MLSRVADALFWMSRYLERAEHIARTYVDEVSAMLGSPSRTADDAMTSLAERWPDGLGRTIEVTDYWFGEDIPAAIVQEVLDFDAQVGQEDTDLVVSVQAGLDSGAVTQGRLMRESEQLIADFQRRVYDAIT